jgi:hypothetical protein
MRRHYDAPFLRKFLATAAKARSPTRPRSSLT